MNASILEKQNEIKRYRATGLSNPLVEVEARYDRIMKDCGDDPDVVAMFKEMKEKEIKEIKKRLYELEKLKTK